jgi:hypothetical protein
LSFPDLNQPFVTGSVQTPAGVVPKISSRLNRSDHWGTIKARWGVGRMHYTLDPGLYALGDPNDQSPVLVTANYKMSFDRLREALPNRNAWILVLDTKGINVWCAAGKGTFGTDELVRRVEFSGLNQVVSHRQLILPQLSGPGVAAYKVKKRTGFQAVFGPIRAADLPVFIDTGLKATPGMREKTFTTRERLVLIPVELVSALKWYLLILPAFFFLGGLGASSGFWNNAWNHGFFAVLNLLGALSAGAILTPVLLPWLPGRAFSLKGVITGVIMTMAIFIFSTTYLHLKLAFFEILGWFLLTPALSAYLAMNFTGSSTFTSLSGVRKEMRWAVPFEIVGGLAGLILWVSARFIS